MGSRGCCQACACNQPAHPPSGSMLYSPQRAHAPPAAHACAPCRNPCALSHPWACSRACMERPCMPRAIGAARAWQRAPPSACSHDHRTEGIGSTLPRCLAATVARKATDQDAIQHQHGCHGIDDLGPKPLHGDQGFWSGRVRDGRTRTALASHRSNHVSCLTTGRALHSRLSESKPSRRSSRLVSGAAPQPPVVC